ncbi:MAG: hypothetical protein J0H64_02235, partial [Actinobacteria bacterium]|nr:hypothetical protein [Actinomycetota bacterium]
MSAQIADAAGQDPAASTASTASATDSAVFTADWVLPVSLGSHAAPAIRHGAVVVVDGLIAWVGERERLPSDYVALPVETHVGILTPGLVNGHTHLQYTGFAELGRGSYRSFEHWSEEFEVFYEAVQDPAEWG